jgi:hypothetical protein
MKALIIDTSNQPWQDSRGFAMAEIAQPSLGVILLSLGINTL